MTIKTNKKQCNPQELRQNKTKALNRSESVEMFCV